MLGEMLTLQTQVQRGLRPAHALSSKMPCFGSKRRLRAILRGFERFSGDFWHFRFFFSDFRLNAYGLAGLLVREVTGGGSPPPKCWQHVGR